MRPVWPLEDKLKPAPALPDHNGASVCILGPMQHYHASACRPGQLVQRFKTTRNHRVQMQDMRWLKTTRAPPMQHDLNHAPPQPGQDDGARNQYHRLEMARVEGAPHGQTGSALQRNQKVLQACKHAQAEVQRHCRAMQIQNQSRCQGRDNTYLHTGSGVTLGDM